MRETEASLPILHSPGYYTKPSLEELVAQELLDPGYCTRVPNFTVGRLGYGSVRFLEKTDVRGLDLDQIVKFYKHEIVVYSDENDKPAVGQGLNKAAEVVLVLDTELLNRFGFGEDDEEDIVMDDADGEMYDDDKEPSTNMNGIELSHSLPAHLRLDPVKMREMRLLMFPHKEEPEELSHKASISKEYARPLQNSAQAMPHRSTPPIARKTPFPLLEYKHGSFDANSPGSILMVQQHKGMPLKTIKAEGFKLDLKHETPVSTNYACNIVDAGLFMGKSFRVGWGPNGILVHSGAHVGSGSEYKVLSSVVSLEKVAFDNFVRDENNKVSEELVESALISPLNFHKEINHVKEEVRIGPCKLKLLKLEANCSMLSDISHGYCDIIERQLTIPGLSSTTHLGLTHQVMTWELIRVLFFDRKQKSQVESLGADNEEDMMQDMKEVYQDVDQEALPLMRRAEFRNIHDALHAVDIDWRRFLGLLMWYKLPPDTSLPIAFQTYKHFLDEGRAPYPVPLLLMKDHQKRLSAGMQINTLTFHSILGFFIILLSLGKCHWAIYVVLHLPFREDCQFLHVNLIREILFQYCEIWSSDESQQQFIEDLGIPSEWIHEALAIYHNYNGDLPKALELFKASYDDENDLVPFDLKGVWTSMEQCHKLGLAKSIGVSNFSIKKLQHILSFATTPPAVNQVGMNASWQQKNLTEYCKAKGIIVTAYSPLGAKGTFWDSNDVMDSELLKDVAQAHGKTVAQVSLRWLYEQDVTIAVKSYNKERMKENLEIFDFSLTNDDYQKINQIKQTRKGSNGPTTLVIVDLFDGEN
ncbi:Nuclear pore complex protein [Arachis hypogaea]|nr:Nuclear pore complex protein [Arachis hypogaea]